MNSNKQHEPVTINVDVVHSKGQTLIRLFDIQKEKVSHLLQIYPSQKYEIHMEEISAQCLVVSVQRIVKMSNTKAVKLIDETTYLLQQSINRLDALMEKFHQEI